MSAYYFRFSARGAPEPQRSALLERLLARAAGFTAVKDWRADAFRVIAPQIAAPAVAAAALLCELGAAEVGAIPGASWVCIAAPLHYVAEMSTVRLAQDGILSLAPPDAQALAADFNRLWCDAGVRMAAGPAGGLYCIFDRAQCVQTRDPEEVLGRRIEEYLPAGADAPRLRQLMSELEMWLFEHAVNEKRAARGLPPCNALWLWGGGALLNSLPAVHGVCQGDDVFFKAFERDAAAGLAPPDAAVIAVSQVPGTEAWRRTESRWLIVAEAQLRARRISRLELSAGDRCFTVTSRGSRRFWRRRTPWWESFP